ncbi:MAG TPA: prepilin peptidase, partial [Patescibacteria group bacterium]|nr:prepilin peptidase [Patescibacteria group bacterium]
MAIIFFFFGLFLGSFLLLVIDRIPKNETVLFGHSHCDFCGHTLSAKDLIPVFSYVFLKGRCRYCHKKLSLSYPLIEVLTGMLLAISVVFLPSLSVWQYVAVCGIVGSLIVIFFSDLFH